MKTYALEDVVPQIGKMSGEAESEPILLTRSGKPVACLFGLKNYDAEDFEYIVDADFWKTIRESRMDDTNVVSLEQVEAELAERERAEAAAAASD
jgi:hypothetical protein